VEGIEGCCRSGARRWKTSCCKHDKVLSAAVGAVQMAKHRYADCSGCSREVAIVLGYMREALRAAVGAVKPHEALYRMLSIPYFYALCDLGMLWVV